MKWEVFHMLGSAEDRHDHLELCHWQQWILASQGAQLHMLGCAEGGSHSALCHNMLQSLQKQIQ